jgi:AcrR family transcriptional regulator
MKEDLRVRKTKKALSDAFISLLKEKHFEEITINELCDRAEIRRATFYKHYTDKLHFLACFTRSLRDQFDINFWSSEKPENTADYYIEYVKRAIEYLDNNSTLVENTLKSDLFTTMMAIITEQNYKDTKARLEKSVLAGMKLHASIETVAAMFTGGVATTIYIWLLAGKQKPAEELAREIGYMIRSNILS